MWRAVHADGVELTASQVIDGDVVRDLEQPTRELELGSIAIDVIEDLDERVLCQILGELAIPHHAIDEREHGPLITPDQLSKRGLSPCLREGDNVRVRQV